MIWEHPWDHTIEAWVSTPSALRTEVHEEPGRRQVTLMDLRGCWGMLMLCLTQQFPTDESDSWEEWAWGLLLEGLRRTGHPLRWPLDSLSSLPGRGPMTNHNHPLQMFCDTRVCGEKSLANADARFWCTQVRYGLTWVGTEGPPALHNSPICFFPSHQSGKKKGTQINFWGPETTRWSGGLPRKRRGSPEKSKLRWAKSRDSYRRIASKSYRCDSNR